MSVRYRPVKKARLFTKNVWYHQIDWNDWPEVIRRFEQQIHWWYVMPIRHLRKKTPHNGFAVVALSCVLVDALNQYHAGIERSTGRAFREFVRKRLPSHGGKFPTPIRVWDESKGKRRNFRPSISRMCCGTVSAAAFSTRRTFCSTAGSMPCPAFSSSCPSATPPMPTPASRARP
jgi:hypothetical protein